MPSRPADGRSLFAYMLEFRNGDRLGRVLREKYSPYCWASHFRPQSVHRRGRWRQIECEMRTGETVPWRRCSAQKSKSQTKFNRSHSSIRSYIHLFYTYSFLKHQTRRLLIQRKANRKKWTTNFVPQMRIESNSKLSMCVELPFRQSNIYTLVQEVAVKVDFDFVVVAWLFVFVWGRFHQINMLYIYTHTRKENKRTNPRERGKYSASRLGNVFVECIAS